MAPEDIKKALDNHVLWLRGDGGDRANLYGANLRGANLRDANLYGANLRDANLYGANLHGANLHGADLHGADLRGANLRDANLYGANLRGANLRGANLYGANLYGANLRGANLRGANLRGADLYGANLDGANLRDANLDESTTFGPRQWLPDGTIRLYKKVYSDGEEYILTLRIDDNVARTSSYVGRKCRAASAFVESATAKDGSPTDVEVFKSGHDHGFVYCVGTIATPDSYDPNPLIECTHGIHGFVTRQEAVDY